MSGRGMLASIAEIAAEARNRRAQIMGRAQRREDGVLVCPALYADGFVPSNVCMQSRAMADGMVPHRRGGGK